MERRYLVATLAVIATFAVFSRGLRALEEYSQLSNHRVEVTVGVTCPHDSSKVSQWMAKARTHLRPTLPEEAQLLAEMNLPIAAMQTQVKQQASRQGEAAARCARELAIREAERGQREAELAQRQAERAQRQAMKMQEKMVQVYVNGSIDPTSIHVNIPDNLQQRIHVQASALADQMTATSMKLQVAADKFKYASMNMTGVPNVDFNMDTPQVTVHTSTHAPCNPRASKTQAQRAVRDNHRSGLRPGECAF
jgi:multidrug efflux pump subunit AcrA (membrane-fusion protein)